MAGAKLDYQRLSTAFNAVITLCVITALNDVLQRW